MLESMHRAVVPAAIKGEVAPPKLKSFGMLLATAERRELKGVGRFDRTARREARSRARATAESWALDLLVLADRDRAERQAPIDAAWAQLAGNDPATVVAALDEAFQSTHAHVATYVIEGDVVSVRIVGPIEQDLPTVKPKMTPIGKRTVAAINKGERASWIAALTAARVLLVSKLVFAQAPGVQAVRAVVTSPMEGGAAVVAASLSRERLGSASWGIGAFQVLESTADELIFQARGRSKELAPIEVPARYGA
jgi:hypothetical protein